MNIVGPDKVAMMPASLADWGTCTTIRPTWPLTKARSRAIGLRINGRDLGFSPAETDGEVRLILPAGSDSLAAEEQPN